MKVRLHGTEDECQEVAARLAEIVDVVDVSRPYADRPPSQLVRVYIETRIDRPTTFVPSVRMPVDPDTPRQHAAIRDARRRNR